MNLPDGFKFSRNPEFSQGGHYGEITGPQGYRHIISTFKMNEEIEKRARSIAENPPTIAEGYEFMTLEFGVAILKGPGFEKNYSGWTNERVEADIAQHKERGPSLPEGFTLKQSTHGAWRHLDGEDWHSYIVGPGDVMFECSDWSQQGVKQLIEERALEHLSEYQQKRASEPELPDGYSFALAEPKGHPPVGVVFGPEGYEKQYPSYTHDKKTEVELDAFAHEREVQQKIIDAAEIDIESVQGRGWDDELDLDAMLDDVERKPERAGIER